MSLYVSVKNLWNILAPNIILAVCIPPWQLRDNYISIFNRRVRHGGPHTDSIMWQLANFKRDTDMTHNQLQPALQWDLPKKRGLGSKGIRAAKCKYYSLIGESKTDGNIVARKFTSSPRIECSVSVGILTTIFQS